MDLEACKEIEAKTKMQSKSNEWFDYRTGRITASMFKLLCRTRLDKPAISIINKVCYPRKFKFTTKATLYGCSHEKDALKDYKQHMELVHQNFNIESGGLFINPKYPHFGASPDGVVNCDCCGLYLVEKKCPYWAKDVGIDDYVKIK